MKRLFLLLFLLCSTAHATNAPFLAWYAQDAQGKAMAGAKLYFYQSGGAVAKNVYSDETCAVSLGASLTADAAGRFRRFYMGALNYCSSPLLYKVVFRTAGGSIVWTEDNVASQKTNLAGIVNALSATGTAAVTATNTSTGYAVSAVATASTDHALNVAGKTALPEAAAVHIVPQDNTPSVLAKGDLWFDSATGRILIHDGTEASQLMFAAKAVCTATTATQNGLTATGNTTGNGCSCTGGTTSGAGGYHTGGAPNGNGNVNVATGAGVAVVADSSGGTGYAVSAKADTSTPASASLHLYPQDTDPGVPIRGDVYVNSTTGKMSIYNGAVWGRVITQVYSLTVTESRATGSVFSTNSLTIPANTLRVGSTIRISANLVITAVVDGSGTFGLGIYQTASGGRVYHVVNPVTSFANDIAYLFLVGTVRAIGAGGSIQWGGYVEACKDSNVIREISELENINTTAAETISIETQSISGGYSVTDDLTTFVVDFSA